MTALLVLQYSYLMVCDHTLSTLSDLSSTITMESRISPTKHELLNLLADINDKWYEIGGSLKVSQNVLNGLTSCQLSNTYKLDQVIENWLTTTESHLVTWETVIDAIKSPIVNNIKKATEIQEYLTREDIDIPSSRKRKQDVQTMELERKCVKLNSDIACQMLHKHSDRILPLTLPVEIVQILYTERVISKETLDEVNRLGGVLGDGPLRALHTTLSEDPSKLKLFASILLKSEQTVPVAKDILKEYDHTFPPQVKLQPVYQYEFDQMRVAFGKLIHTVAPLIEAGIPSLKELKTYLRRCFEELEPQLVNAESFDDVIDVVQHSCTIINVCCLEAIVNHYKITEAKQHIVDFKTAVDEFCKKIKADICIDQTFTIDTTSHHLICETIEFVVEWKINERTLSHIEGLLSKAFKDMAKSVQVRAIKKGNSIIVTCYAPHYMMNILLITAEENLDVLKEMGLIKLTLSYHTIYDKCQRDKEVRTIVEENTKELRSQLELRQTISKKMTLQISSVVQQSEERKQMKEKTIKDLTSLLKWKEVIKEELLSVSTERQKELETLQEVMASLMLRLRERNKQFEVLRQNLKELKDQLKGSADNKDETTPPKSPVLHDILKDYDDNKETKDEESDKRGNQQHLVSYYKTVLKVGVIPIKIVKCILTGPPEAGKSTLKRRLLGEVSFWDQLNYYHTDSVSTGVSDSPLIVAVRNVSQESVIVSDSKWTTMGFRDQAEAILETLTSTIHDAIQELPSDLEQATNAESVVSTIQASTLEQGGKNTESLSSKCVKSNFQESKVKSKKQNECQDLDWPVRELRKMVNSIPAEKSKSNSQKFATIEDLNKNPMLRIIDTGGQPELHELFPVFVTGPAINLVVFRLDRPLQNHYEIQYRKKDSKSEPYQSSLTHEEMVFRSLASIASLGYGQQLPTVTDQSPAAFIIATHKDLVTDEVVHETNSHLESVIKDGHFYQKDIVQYYNGDQAIFAVNCIAPKCEEIDVLRERVFKVVKQNFHPLSVPVPWLILSIKLQMALEKKELHPVISYDKCKEFAEACGIQSDDLKAVLWFFHNAMGVVMYFPTVPELESIVILDLQVIFDCITELITSCFLFENIGSKVGSEEFFKYGCFSMKNLKRVLSEQDIGNIFTAEQMVALLLHLNVIARLDRDKFFMPCALKSNYEFSSDPDSYPACLLVGFECGYCPVGLFTSLVVYLLSKPLEYEWKLSRGTQYRNQICFRVGFLDEVTLIARPTYLEIQVSRESSLVSGSQANVCQHIRSVVNEGINVVLKSLHYVDTKHHFGFLCPFQCKPSHPAVVCEDPSASCLPQAYKCKRKKEMSCLMEKHLIWYGKEPAVEKLNKILEIPDLNDVLNELVDFNDWMKLGLALGLYFSTLDKIEQNRGSDVDRCKMEMLHSWLKKADGVERKGGPTWRQLISALEKIDKALADKITETLEK